MTNESLFSFVIFNKEIPYDERITLRPVTMKDILSFQFLSQSLTVRKNSTFHEKDIIKMTYLEFLRYSLGNKKLENRYQIPGLSQYFLYAVQLLQLCCRDADIRLDQNTGEIYLCEELLTPKMFDDLRRIIIVQNDIDFDMDEFLHHDTEQRLMKARNDLNKDKNRANIEDYIDSLVIAMNTTEERIMNMTIRKFWRYIRRFQLKESYTIAKTGECSGMVTFKEPLKHWMTSFEDLEEDKYRELKTDETSLRRKL